MKSSLSAALIAVVVVLILGAASFAYAQLHGAAFFAGPVTACTLEAKICPDGSAVGRVGPNCEFAPCPSEALCEGGECPVATTTPTTPTGASSASLAVGDTKTINGTTITILGLDEDSRCPVDVQCIQAGTVRARTAINSYNSDFIFTLGQPQTVGGSVVTLSSVVPAQKYSTVTVAPSAYRFTFMVVPATGLMTITRDSGNETVYLKKGQQFKVALGTGLNWSIAFDPSAAVTRVAGANSADGSQGVFTAAATGTVTLTGTGAPICNAGEACPQYLVAFTTTLVITN